jgi:hypothetical protein
LVRKRQGFALDHKHCREASEPQTVIVICGIHARIAGGYRVRKIARRGANDSLRVVEHWHDANASNHADDVVA